MVDTITNAPLEEWLTDKEIEFVLKNMDQEVVLIENKVSLFLFSDQSKFSSIKVLKILEDLDAIESQTIEPSIKGINMYHATKGVYIGFEGAKNNDLLLELIKFLAQKDLDFATKMHSDYLHFGSLTEEFEEDEENHRFYIEIYAIYQFVSQLESNRAVLFEATVEMRTYDKFLCIWDKAQGLFFVFEFNAEDCSVYMRNMKESPACSIADWSAIQKSLTAFDKIGKFQAAKTVGATKELYSYLESVQCLVVDYLVSNKCIDELVYFHDEADMEYIEEDEDLKAEAGPLELEFSQD